MNIFVPLIEKEILKFKELQKKATDQEVLFYEQAKSKLEACNSIEKILEIDFIEINRVLNCLSDEILKKIEIYKKFGKMVNFPLNNDQKNELFGIVNYIVNFVKQKIMEIRTSLNEKNNDINNNINKLILLRDKLIKNENIDSDDVSILCEILKNDNINFREGIIFIGDLVTKSIRSLSSNASYEDSDPLVIKETTNIDEKDIIALFKDFGLDFNLFSSAEKKKICLYGNIENMRGILEIFRDNHIKVELNERSNQISDILIHSTTMIVETIINNIKADITNGEEKYDLSNVVQMYIGNPALFINGRIKCEIERGKSGFSGNNDTEIIGAYNNYINNRDLFISIGVDMQRPSSAVISMLSFSHNKIKSNIQALDLYGIPREKYVATITCLKSSYLMSTLDRFIELGYYDYIINNLSLLCRKYDDAMFYRIIKCIQDGKQHDDLYYNKSKPTFHGYITNLNSSMYGINDDNKKRIVNQYDIKCSYDYDEFLSGFKNCGPLSLVYKDKYISKLEFYAEDQYKYNFNGVIISRFKVLRLYETLLKNFVEGSIDNVKYVIYRDSILTEEQYLTVEQCLSRIYGVGKGVHN